MPGESLLPVEREFRNAKKRRAKFKVFDITREEGQAAFRARAFVSGLCRLLGGRCERGGDRGEHGGQGGADGLSTRV